MTPITATKKYDLVFGVGGVVGAYEGAGAICALEEVTKTSEKPGLQFATVTGGSSGAALATMYTNGIKGKEILLINLLGRKRMLTDPFLFWRSVIVPQPEQWNLSHSVISLERPWADEVARLKLVPNDRLQCVAFAPRTGQPVLFKGKDYPATMLTQVRQRMLATFLAASGAYRDMFAPVLYKGEWLVDAGYYKAVPDEFALNEAIVLKFTNSAKFDCTVSPDNFLIDLTRPEVDGLDFYASEATCLNLFEDGYKRTAAALKQAIASGRLIVQ